MDFRDFDTGEITMSWQHILKMVNVRYRDAVADDIIDFLKNDFANELGIVLGRKEGYSHMNRPGLNSTIKTQIGSAIEIISEQPRLDNYNRAKVGSTRLFLTFGPEHNNRRLWFYVGMRDEPAKWEFTYQVELTRRLKKKEITPEDVERVVNKFLNMVGINMEHPLMVENINRYLEE